MIDGQRADLSSVGFHTRVIDLGDKLDLGRLEGVIVREVQVDGEDATTEGSALRTLNHHVPDHNIFLSRHDFDTCNRCLFQVAKLLQQS